MTRILLVAASLMFMACDPVPMSVPPAQHGPARPDVRQAPPPSSAMPANSGNSGNSGANGAGAGDDAGTDTTPPVDDDTARGDGESCDTDDQCGSGVCEGEGCGEGEGVCAAANRMCTRDRRPYCGCDGVTFYSSGSCPGQRYANKGACKS